MTVRARWTLKYNVARLWASIARRRYMWKSSAQNKAELERRRRQVEYARRVLKRHPAGGPVEGLDWAWGRADIAQLKREGIRFACRYLSHDHSKNLTHAEAKALSKAGINCVVVWETTANRAASGRSAGVSDATEARAQAHACGMPASRPIYFAVDFDGTVDQVRAYFQGVNTVLGVQRTGVYGGFRVVKGLLDAGLARYAWQTYAWSGGHWDPRCHIQQYQNGVRVAGVNADRDRAMHSDYGQWRTS
jgi:hypothetical protein